MFDPLLRPQELDSTESRDFAMIAHDVRGALQGVIGGVAILDSARLDPGARAQFERIAAAAQTLNGLVCNLLGEQGPAEPGDEPTLVDLKPFLKHLSDRWSGEAQEFGLRFVIDAGPDIAGILRADPVSLSRALGNLITNALRYAQAGTVHVAVRCKSGGDLSFSVADSGPGFPVETVEAVLHRGPRPIVLTRGGHGLGLHIVRDLCTEMSATLALRNLEPAGAEATLTFPADLFRPAPVAADPAVSEEIDLQGLRILLAEDNPTNQIVATQMLHALNAEVTLSSDGVEALEKFEVGDFDLVVVDIEMPRLTGLDVIRAIRGRSDARSKVPIVALTAYAMRDHRDRIADAGANGLISKPITSIDALGRALRAHVSPNRLLRTPVDVSADEDPVADLAVFDALSAAIGSGMMEELLEKVVADLTQAKNELLTSLSPLDLRPIRSASHILISVAGAVGAVRLQSCARALNKAAQAEDGGDLPGDVRRCIAEIDLAVAFADNRRTES